MTIARIKTLVSTNWLAEQLSHLRNPRHMRVLDTSFVRDRTNDSYKEFYLDKHIPGAKYFDLHKCVESTKYIPRNLPDLACFTNYVQNLGVWADTHVITYDRDDTKAACRAWWLFRLHGHSKVSILDGGLQKWAADGFDTAEEDPVVVKSDFEPVFQSQLLRDYEAMLRNVESKEHQTMDCRGQKGFRGEKEEANPDMKKGHIPGAKNIPYDQLFNEDGTFKSEHDLKLVFDAVGIDLSLPLVATCETAMTACGLSAAAHMLGKTSVPVYYGSWTEWSQRSDEKLCVKGKD